MNAAALRAFDELSAATGEALWPGTVTIGGTAYAAGIVRPREGMVIGPFADEPEAVTLTVRLRKSVLATAPAVNSYLTWEAARWKVRAIGGAEAASAVWVLTCQPAP